jgi:hypothetical protein
MRSALEEDIKSQGYKKTDILKDFDLLRLLKSVCAKHK